MTLKPSEWGSRATPRFAPGAQPGLPNKGPQRPGTTPYLTL